MANKKEIKLILSVDPQLGGVKKFETALEQSLNSISDTAKMAGMRVDAAMKSLGVNSSSQIKKEINSIRQAFDIVKNSGTASARDIDLAWSRSQKKIAALRGQLNGLGGSYTSTSKKLQAGMSRITGMLGRMQAAVGAFFAVQGAMRGVSSIVALADSYTLLNGRLKLVTGSAEELEFVQKRLFDIAQGSRQTYEGTAEVFNRFAQAVKGQGVSSGELLTITESLNKAFVISGATSTEAKNTMIQLSQAFSSGVLRGDEFRSVMEQGSRVVDMLTDHLGVNRGELRKMAESGQITADVMRDAFAAGIGSVNEEFEQLPITVGQSMTLLHNEWGKIVDDFNNSEGVTDGLAGAIKLLAENLELVISGAYRLGVAMVLIGGSLAVDGIIGRLALLTRSLKTTTIAASKLQKVFMIFAAATAGWEVGKFLNKFKIVKKGMLGFIHYLDLGRLKIKQFWAYLSGGDTAAVQREIDVAKGAYASLIDDINKGRDVGVSSQQSIAVAARKSAAEQAAATKAGVNKQIGEYKRLAAAAKKLMPGEKGYKGSDAWESKEAIEGAGLTLDEPEDGMTKDEIAAFYKQKKQKEKKEKNPAASEKRKELAVEKEISTVSKSRRLEESAASRDRLDTKKEELRLTSLLDAESTKPEKKTKRITSSMGSASGSGFDPVRGAHTLDAGLTILNGKRVMADLEKQSAVTLDETGKLLAESTTAFEKRIADNRMAPIAQPAQKQESLPSLQKVYREYNEAKSIAAIMGDAATAWKAPEKKEPKENISAVSAMDGIKKQVAAAMAVSPIDVGRATTAAVGDLVKKMSGGQQRYGAQSTASANVPKKIVEIRFPGGSLTSTGNESDADAFVSYLEKAGLTA